MKKTIVCAVVLSLFHPEAYADSFKILGARPLAMGGAFVAVADNALAQYWNPAGLGSQTNFDLQIPIGARVEFTGGVLNSANNLGDLASQYSKIQSAQKSGGALDAKQLSAFFQGVKGIQDLNQPGKGALIDIAGGPNIRAGRIALSVNNFTTVGVTPFVDATGIGLGTVNGSGGITLSGSSTLTDSTLATTRDQLATVVANSRSGLANSGVTFNTTDNTQIANALINNAQTNGSSNADITSSVSNSANIEPLVRSTLLSTVKNAYANNTSNLQFRGASLTQAAIGYAHTFFLRNLYWGANVKIISGVVGYYKQNILQNSTGAFDPVSKLTDNSKTTVKPSIDLGLLYDKRKDWRTRFGIVAKDLNSPTFDQPASAVADGLNPYKLNSQVRAGVAVYPLNFWTVAMDVDVTKNLTEVDGFTSRMWGLGTEINVFNRPWLNIPLRAGLMKNISESDSKLAYTAGFGLNFLHVVVEVSGAVSSQTVNIKSDTNSQSIPTNVAVGATISALFGGRRDSSTTESTQ